MHKIQRNIKKSEDSPGVLPNNPPDLAAGVVVSLDLSLSVVEFVAAGPKLNPPVLGAVVVVEVLDASAVVFVVAGAPKPNPPEGAGAFDVSAAAAGAAPNNPPPLGFVFDASSDFDGAAAKLNPPPLPPAVVEGAGAVKLNPPPAAGAGALVDDGAPKLNPIVLY